MNFKKIEKKAKEIITIVDSMSTLDMYPHEELVDLLKGSAEGILTIITMIKEQEKRRQYDAH